MAFEITKLLANYGKTSDEEIRDLLGRIKLVDEKHQGVGSIYGYYELDKESLEKLLQNPRGASLTFDMGYNQLVVDELDQYDEAVVFYVKSSSHFFLKPDIGEIVDQLTPKQKELTKAIKLLKGEGYYEIVPGTDKSHFICYVVLLR